MYVAAPRVKILVLEDDPKVAGMVARLLAEEGYAVDVCSSGEDAIERATLGGYDALLLDWMVPDVDGIDVCREVRRRGCTTPILMLTARGETNERVLGLDAGADDFVAKPFEVEELVARVRALVRRGGGAATLRRGALVLNRVGRRAMLEGVALTLTGREFDMLLHLASRMGEVVTRADLLAQVFETKFDPGSNLVEVHVSRVREKLRAFAWMIETVRGAGYRFRTIRAP